MARETFLWHPEWDENLQQAPNVVVSKFGDGYEQRAAVGINSNPESWSLQFSLSNSDGAAALAFVKSHGAVTAFLWANPLGVTNLYVCRKWELTNKKGLRVMKLTFEQVFEAL